jgi:hypothetical protein
MSTPVAHQDSHSSWGAIRLGPGTDSPPDDKVCAGIAVLARDADTT